MIHNLNIDNSPYLKWSYDSTTGKINGENNQCAVNASYNSAFCWTDMSGCPAGYPYKTIAS